MKKIYQAAMATKPSQFIKFLLFVLLTLNQINSNAQSFTPGRIVALQVGDGSATLSSSATPVFLKEFSPTGVSGISISLPTSGNNALTMSGSATSEGLITRSSDKSLLIIPGYNAVAGTASIAGTNSATVPRTIGKISSAGIFSIGATTTSFSANNPRGATSDGNNFWGSGANTGIVLETAGAGTIVSSTSTNNRSLAIYNNNLYFSTGSGTRGIYQVGSGLPTTTGNASTLLFSSSTSASSPYQFAFSPNGTTAYVADDATGIYKWTFNGSTWSSVVVNATPCRGLIVDFSNSNPIIYATTTTTPLNAIIKITDLGSGYPIASSTLATAPPNTAFRGIAFAPEAPNPSVSISVNTNTASEANQTQVTVTATASAPVSGDQSISLIISGNGINTGDYNLSNATITIPNGSTTGSVTFTVVDDNEFEGQETATLTIDAPSSGITLGTTISQDIVITDNDPSPAPTVSLSVSTNNASESSATIVTITATASSPVAGDQTVSVGVSGTGITAGDYMLSNPIITIPNGNTAGSETFTIVDDNSYEGTETATLAISNPSSGLILGTPVSQNISITDNDFAKIHDIQGSGSTFNSAFSGTQTIEGIVIGVFPGTTKLRGFYVQEEDSDTDNNSNTSEGIFVFDPAGLYNGSTGRKVQVTGNVSEFTSTAANIAGTGNSSLTEISASSVVDLGASNLPVVTNVTLPVNDFTDLERYEGMLVNVSSANGPLTVTETFKIGRYGQVGLSGAERLIQYTQQNPPSVSGYSNYLANLQDNYIILDDGSSTQNPDPEIFARGGLPLSASNTLRAGDNISSITGIMDQRFEGYRVQTTSPVNFLPANARESIPPSVGGNVKVSFFNVLNYFTDLDQGTIINIPDGVSFEPRGANSATEFTRQRDKIISAIDTINADIIGVSEIENDGTKSIQDLVNGLNAGGTTYSFINDQFLKNDPNPATNAVGTDAIKVALIYKSGVVTPVDSAFTFTEPNPSNPIFSRPPVAQTFITNSGVKFTIIVNHFKSKSSANSLPGDTDQGDGQSLSNATRVAQAQALLTFINTVKTITGDDKILVIGDLNSYALEDPITTLTNGGLSNLFSNTSYSFQFNGQWGALDHALASQTLSSHVTGAAKWHINSDEPVVLDYNTEFKSAGQISSFYQPDAFRSSDHDPVIVGLDLTPNAVSLSVSSNSTTETNSNSITVTASSSSPVSGNQTININVSGVGITNSDYNLSNTTITIPDGASSGSVSFTANNDGVLEGDETAMLTISNPSSGITLGNTVSQNILISDKESSINLCNYVRIGRYDLPEPTRTIPPANSRLAQEVSAVTYNWDTQTLFVVGDGGTSIVQVSKTGQLINSMTLAQGGSPQGTEFYDTEGLTYIGNGQFVMAEERDRQAVLFTYVPGTTLTRANTKTVKLGTFVQNIGIEGISYDPLTNGYICVKETTPEGIFQTGIDFDAGTATNGSPTTENSINLFDPSLAKLADFADVFALSNLPVLNGQPNYGNLLVLSQESGKIVNIDRSGNISSSLTIISDPGNPLSVPAQQHEGLTMDRDGNLYVVSENGGGDFDHPQLWVYAPSTVANQAPTAIVLDSAVTSVVENTRTTSHLKVADINVSDDGLRCNNNITVSGPDAVYFEAVGTELFIKAGTVLDYETKNSYVINVDVDDPTTGGNVDATTSYTLHVTDAVIENPPGVTITISEVAPWSSGSSPVAADWFEMTNTGTNSVDITGWKMDDNSNSFASSVALNGISTIAPGESVIFIESSSPATIIPQFLNTWFGANPPSGLQIGTYTGSGVGLGTGGDAINIYNGSGEVQARVSFGASPAGPAFPTFNNALGLNDTTISTLSVVGVNDAFAAVNHNVEIGSPGSIGKIYITEVAPWSSGNSPVAADWFEITNTKATSVDLTGWKMDDNSGSFAASVPLSGVTNISPGESVIFIESNTPSSTIPTFQNTWFGANPPASLQIGTYTGSGVGLGTGGDAVNLYNSSGILQTSVLFGNSPTGTFKTFDNASKLNNTTISQLSAVGVNGAFIARNDTNEIGSPGAIVSLPCATIIVNANVSTPISCNGDSATINVNATGGTAPYKGVGQFKIAAGTYTFTVSDAYGCSSSATITISEPSKISLSADASAITCGNSTTTVTITASGGTGVLQYSIDGNPYVQTNSFIVSSGSHIISVKDENGCTVSKSISIDPAPSSPEQPIVSVLQPTCNSANGVITVTSATDGLLFSLDGTSYAGYPSEGYIVVPGNHTLSAKNAAGCVSTDAAIMINPQPSAPLAPVVKKVYQPTCSNLMGSIVLKGLPSGNWTITNATTEEVINGNGSNATINNLAPGTYSFTVSNSQGCASSASANVVINAATGCGPVDSANCYAILNHKTGKAVTVAGGKLNEGASIIQKTFTNENYQKFKFIAVESGFYKIVAQHSGKVIAVKKCSLVQNAVLVQQTFTGADCQKWSLTKIGIDYLITNKATGKVMAITAPTASDIVQQTNDDAGRQEWSISAVGCSASPAKQISSSLLEVSLQDPLSLKVYPNPSVQQFTVVIRSDKQQSIYLSVKDNLGRVLETKENVSVNTPIHLGANLRGGVYYLQIIQGENKIIRKIIKL